MHFLGLKTGGASFAIDTEERELVMWMSRRLAALDSTSFATMLAEFLEYAAWWKDRLQSGDDSNSPPSDAFLPPAPRVVTPV